MSLDSKTNGAEQLRVARKNLKKAKCAVVILEKSLTDPRVRGEASIEYVEDRLRRGRLLIKRLEVQITVLRENDAYKTE